MELEACLSLHSLFSASKEFFQDREGDVHSQMQTQKLTETLLQGVQPKSEKGRTGTYIPFKHSYVHLATIIINTDCQQQKATSRAPTS